MDRKIKKRIAIVGSGVIGEAAGRGLHLHGHEVIFCDIDTEKIEALTAEGFTAIHPDALPTHEIDVFLLSIQTPTVENGVDLAPLKRAYAAVGDAVAAQREYSVVATRSTVPVGTAEDVAIPIIEEQSGKRVGVHFDVVANPEYLRELTAFEDFMHPRVIVVGVSDERTEAVMRDVYHPFDAPVHVLTVREAEMQKYIHNLLNAAKISFFNEQRKVCDELGVSADAIFPVVIASAEAMWNPKYGTKNLGPYGGACLPKDVKGFLHFVEHTLEIDMPLLRSVDEVNEKTKRDAVGDTQ